MRFLLDGYNLLYALGLASRDMTGKALERARLKMLDWLADRHGDGSGRVHVVFDALHATRNDQTTRFHRGIEIEFAFKELADDRIEEWIAAEDNPRTLRVVSNDGRIRHAAHRRGCVAWSSQEYVDWLLLREEKRTPEAVAEEKAEEATDAEMRAWLAAFEKRD